MRCPACANNLVQLKTGSIIVDGCSKGCGGIWLDPGELEQVDEGHEPVAETVLQLLSNANVLVNRAKERRCPKCPGAPLDRLYFSENYHTEIDLCRQCGGTFLDLGELRIVRNYNDADAMRSKIIEDFEIKARSAAGSVRSRISAVLGLLF